jgi:molybdenum cofactor cytidylyltransferase
MLDGRVLVQHVVDAATAATLDDIVVVVGHDAQQVCDAITLPAGGRIVLNPDYMSGQGSSVRVGIRALGDATDRAVILLADQPRMSPAVIRAVASGPGPIRRARYRGVPGHPVAFDRELWAELEQVEGDQGARNILAARDSQIGFVEVDTDMPVDVDTDDDVLLVTAES